MECPRCHGAKKELPALVNECALCLGMGTIDDCQLSPHFKYSELVASSHKNFANDPNASQIGNLRALCQELLEPVRNAVGPMRVTSGYRSQNLDAFVAGPPFDRQLSGHSIGAAADVQPLATGVTLKTIMDWVAFIGGLKFDQAIIEGGCVHLAIYAPYGSDRQRRQCFVRMVNPGRQDDPHAIPFIYARYSGSPEQMALIA